jgi:hypothetical protein
MRCAPILALAIAACGAGSPETRFALETQPATNLVGAWDATLSLVRPYQLELHEPGAKRIRGTIAFVASPCNRRVESDGRFDTPGGL